jgi:hypothetical protein
VIHPHTRLSRPKGRRASASRISPHLPSPLTLRRTLHTVSSRMHGRSLFLA